MTDNTSSPRDPATGQLGARARTILRSLAENGSAKLPSRSVSDPHIGEPTPANDQRRQARVVEAVPAAAPNVSSGVAEPNKIVPLPRRGRPAQKPDQAPARRPVARAVASKPKTSLLKISALLAIGLPTAIASVYYGAIAAPQYVAEAKFAVRSPEETPVAGGNLIGQITGVTSAALVTSESFIVAQFIESRHLVDNLQKSIDLRSIYTHENADLLARYRPLGADTAESLARHWNTVSSVYYEPISGIITLTVRAFSPEEALKIARETVRESESLVNKLSARARDDAIFDTKQELSRAELRLKFARKAIQDYRDREGSVDPGKNADSQLTIVSTLEGELAKQEADMASAVSFLSTEAPTVRVMRNKIDALKKRIGIERAKIGSQMVQGSTSQSRPLLSSSLAEFEGLQTEREFAEKSYQSAGVAVENARIRAERQARYLATFVEPQLPQASLYPERIRTILLVLLCSAIAWAIGVLIFYGIRDHAA